MKEIQLTKGRIALVDDADFEWLSAYSWCCVPAAGAMTRIGKTRVLMHRLIVKASPGQAVDHVNHDRFDNRRKNLRIATPAQNMWNRRSLLRRFKGVYDKRRYYPGLKKSRRPFFALIMRHGERFHLGFFRTEEEAARAYDRKAVELFGEFACLNFPREKIS